jgi:hypothetical protein
VSNLFSVQVHISDKAHRRIRNVLVAVILAAVLLVLGIAAYANHLRTTATALVASAREIRTTDDAERTIAAWKARAGEQFWTESEHLGGDHNYDAQIVNLSIARFRIVQPTGVTVGVTMRGGKLRSVTVTESVGWSPVASVWVQEWFDETTQNHFHVGSNRRPSTATVEFRSSIPEAQRRAAFSVNTNCFVDRRGCKSADEILPGVWQLENSPSTPD